jgi:hypothetical protein
VAKRALAFLFLLACSVARSQILPISIELMGKPRVETRSRQVVSLVFKVSNRSAGVRTLSVDPALPKPWKNLFQDDWFFLDPDASEIKIASFLVPAGTPAGEYPIRCWLRDKDGLYYSTYCDMKVAVSKELSVELVLLESPRYAIAGREYTAQFAVTNSGNADILVDPAVKSSMSLPYAVKGLEIGKGTLLPRGAVREFTVTVKTYAELARSMTHQLQVDMRLADAAEPRPSTATPDGKAPQAKPARASATVEVIPLSLSEAALFYGLPFTSAASAEARYYGDWSASLKETLKAEGALDEAGRHRIRLGVAKRIGTDGDPLLDQADRYSLEYIGPSVEAGIGDLSYSVSPLLAEKQFGRGAKASVDLASFRLGALYFMDAWSGNGAQSLSATSRWTAPPPASLPQSTYSVGVNLHSPLTDRLSVGILQEYSPFEGIRAVLDNAAQVSLDGSWEAASYALSDGSLGPFSWNARFCIGSPGFSGRYADLLSLSMQAACAPLGQALALRGGYSLRRENYLLGQGLPSAPEDVRITAGIDGLLPRARTALRLEWENFRHDDLLPALLFDGRKDSFRLSAKQPLPPFDLDAQAAVGIGRDVKAGTTSLDQDHRLALGYSPDSSAKASLQLRYVGLRAGNGESSDQLIIQAGLILPVGRAELNFGAINGYRFSSGLFMGTRLSVDARFAYALALRQTLSAHASLSYSSETDPGSLSGSLGVAYALPFELPIGRKSDTAIVSGTVLDAQSGLPAKGALLRLDGLAAITDAAGKFVFYIPHTGKEYLFLEPGSVPADLVPMADMPMELELATGKKTTVEIALSKSCSISGTVRAYGFKDQSGALVRSDGSAGSEPAARREQLFDMSGLVVELSNDGRKWRRLTGSGGDFRFQDLRPGTYVLRVVGGLLPDHFKLETPSLEIEAAGGSSVAVEFRAIEEQRVIKMQEYELPVGD